MKRILIIIAIIPLFANAQSRKTNSTTPPLIESITTDTVKGKFLQVLFSYDEINRVVGIAYKRCKIITDSSKKVKLVEAITENETFEYQGSAKQPYVRVTNSYNNFENKDKWVVWHIGKTYFLYEKGKRVGDSSLFQFQPSNYGRKDDFTWNNNIKTDKRVSKLQQTKRRIYQKAINTYSSYSDSMIRALKINPYYNISNDFEQFHSSERGRVRVIEKNTNFKGYDSMVNPLNQLNIADALCDGRITFELSNENESFDDVDVLLNIHWYFLNQNNILNYVEPYDGYPDTFKHFEELYSLKYSYNQYKQPVYVKIEFKKLIRDREVKSDSFKLLKKFTKNFTFRYKE